MKIKHLTILIVVFTLISACKTQDTKVIKSNETLSKSSTPKNILFLSIDDLKPLLNAYGETQMHTPNFDKLAKMGVIFNNAQVQQAVCGPSRASVMTGMYPDHTKVWDLHTDFRESAPELQSMPEYLITQGYETSATGKIYHQPSAAPGHDGKSWSIAHTTPDYFDKTYGNPVMNTYQDPETKRKFNAFIEEAKTKGITKTGKQVQYARKKIRPSSEGPDVSDQSYLTGLYTTEAIKKMDKMLETGKPFFLAVGYQKPHLPFVAPKKYWDLYDRDKINIAEFQELSENTPKIAYHSFGELRAYTDIPNDITYGDKLPEDKQRELIHGYMACISYVDAQIGKLFKALEDRNILDSTVIVLWGDHGYHLGDHTLWNKHSNFEQATRIPLMFAGPGVTSNKKIEQPVELVDVFPTLFDLAGVTTPKLDGKSLIPLLDNDPKTTIDRDYAISQYRRHKEKMGYSLRTVRYRYTEWFDEGYRSYEPYNEEKILAKELYDYEKDPLETKNLANDSNYKEVVDDLHKKLKTHLKQQYQLLNK